MKSRRSLTCARRRFQLLAMLLCFLMASAFGLGAAPSVVLNEIHYHPVEKAAFNTNGTPFLDLSDDVHEFVEIYNAGSTNVPLAGWKLSGDIDYNFPTNAVIVAGKYLVIAKNPTRLLSISQYALNASNVFGPYQHSLGNGSGSVRLRDTSDNLVELVNYSSSFPWAIGADALGADDEWTGLVSSNFQYRGRSLERVSATWPANDPANWLASPAPGNPSPARANAVTRTIPKPVVIARTAYQDSNGDMLIRSNQPVRIDCTFSATNVLSGVLVEYFLDDINVTNEARSTVSMTVTGAASAGRYTAVLPGRADRTVVRYRIRANRGTGLETVSPRSDDPFAWHGYFVTPTRSSTNRIYDCFISTASLNTLATNLNPANPAGVETSVFRRIINPNPPGAPSPYWNATEPAIFIADGEVYDARARYHGSQYRRMPGNNSWKWQFPRYKPFDDREGVFISDNDDTTVVAGVLYRAAGVPQSYTKWIDFYLNNSTRVTRMDQDEMDDGLVKRFFTQLRRASPELPKEGSGEFYKAQGNFLFSDPTGPFGYGGYRILPARPPYWTELQRYENTYGLQMNGWKGHVPFMQTLHDLWSARGDSPTNVNPNLPALRSWLGTNFDVDATLTSMAIRTWCGGWDNFNHNTFLWKRENGLWAVLQWDFDMELTDTTTSIYASEYKVPAINTQFDTILNGSVWVDANWINDSFFKAYREEYKQKLWLLNNTILNPTNMSALGIGSYSNYAAARFASINTQVGFGSLFHHPLQPVNIAPYNGQAALPPQVLQASPYHHSTNHAQGPTTWFIRAANGTYAAPVFKTTSASNLTSIPIPFGNLDFGATYYWKCIYTDTNLHPSLESAETAFIYGAEPSVAPLIAIDATTLWRYNARGTNQPATWKTNDFDDSLWLEGAALFGTNNGPLPEPIRTPLTLGSRVTTYFRKSFMFSGDPATSFLRLRHVIDDGVVIYLNGLEIHRIGMTQPPGSNVFNGTLAGRAVTDPVYEGPFDIFPANLRAGLNLIAAEVHRSSTISTDVVFGLVIETAAPPTPGSVVLNEILADNRNGPTNAGTHPDYIELFNNTSVTQNLNGLSLSDKVTHPGKYIFPPGASIPPMGHLVLWCDNETNAPGLHTGFSLDNDGQTVALFTVTTNGFTLSDTISFGLQIPDHSISRVPEGSGAWTLTQPTPGTGAIAVPTGSAANLKINEWMASDTAGPDWFELYNPGAQPVALAGLSLTDSMLNPTNTRIASLSFIAPGGYRQFIADQNPGQNARHVNFKLNGDGEFIGLYDVNGGVIDSISFGVQSSGVSEGRLPDGSANIVAFPTTATPEEPNYLPIANLVINEILSHSDPPLQDAVEIYNPTGAEVDISNWWLSDDKYEQRKYQFPIPSIVPAGGFLVVQESQFNPNPGAPGSFAFSSAHGDAVYLSAADGLGQLTGLRTGGSFDAAENGVSFGRFETSQGTVFTALSARTFEAPNAGAKVGPVVITEILFHPQDLPGGVDNSRDEFIELRNITGEAVPLFNSSAPTNRWRLRDAVDFTFPPGITLLPGESILVVGFDPVADAVSLAGFLDTHGTLNTRIFGPWSGKLDNSGDSVELVKPDAPVSEPGPDFGYVPGILVDRVHYSESFPWPETADGTGFSIMRWVPTAYGNDPTNWFAWAPTPGGANFYNGLPSTTLTSPENNATFLGPTSILLAATASDADGSIYRVDFYDGTNKIGQASSAPYSFTWNNASFGLHTLTARGRDSYNGSTLSAPVTIRVVSRPPLAAITSPANGAIFVASNLVTLAATATDPDTPVTKVAYYVDGSKIAEATTPPYSTNWVAIAGSHQLTAVATDTTGISATSAPVKIFVQSLTTVDTILVASNSVWRYLDNGTDPGMTWTNLTFPDSGWFSGAAELGYGDITDGRPETTLISYGPTATNKYIAYYFRQQFVVASPADYSGAILRVMRDDGALAWLNGVEVFRNNLPTGPVNSQTLALAAISGADEYTFYPTNISTSQIVAGTNILAVEIHQNTNSSSDISFAAELRVTRQIVGPAIVNQPVSRSVSPGESVTFVVNAIGGPPLGYQWRFNGSPIPGQTSTQLTLLNIQLPQAGGYSVTVSNGGGIIASVSAALAVGDSDFDGDGLPDAWELAHGLNPLTNADRLLDPDGDGMNNTSEFIAGTDPTNASSVLRIDTLSFGRTLILDFAGDANRVYTIEKNDALGTAPWTPLAELVPTAAAQTRHVADAGNSSSRFYRLVADQNPVTPLRLASPHFGTGAILTFNAVSNRVYVVEYSDTLQSASWVQLVKIPAQTTTRPVTVSDPASTPARVYRLVIP